MINKEKIMKISIRKAPVEPTYSWSELADAIHNNQKLISVNDEIDIELKDGQKITLVCENVNKGHALFSTKDLLADTHTMNENWLAKGICTMDDYLDIRFRNLLPDDLRAIIGCIRLFKEKEIFSENKYGEKEYCSQLERYKNPQNRIKKLNGVAFPWWTGTPYASSSFSFCLVGNDGSDNFNQAYFSYGLSPCLLI